MAVLMSEFVSAPALQLQELYPDSLIVFLKARDHFGDEFIRHAFRHCIEAVLVFDFACS